MTMEKGGSRPEARDFRLSASYLKEPRSHVKQKQPGSQNARILFPHLSYNPDAK